MKECALAHSRAEARLPRQPSTLAPSAHPRGAFLSYGNEVSYTIKKNPAKQDSPPAAGRASDILPFRRSAIRAERFLSYGNEVSYTIKKENIISDVLFSMLSSVSFFLPNPSFLLHWQVPILSAAPLRKALQALSGCLPRTTL